MDRAELPLIAPQYEPRYISADDVVALVDRGKVAGVNYDDHRIQEIRECVMHNAERVRFIEARQRGYLHDGAAFGGEESRKALFTAWKWWCTAAGHPHIVKSIGRHDLYQVRCDLITTGKRWSPMDIPQFARILGEETTYYHQDHHFSVDDRVLVIGGLVGDVAISISRDLVEYVTTGTFQQRPARILPEPDPHGILVRPHVPIDRLR